MKIIQFNLKNLLVVMACVVLVPLVKADWKIVEKANPLGPGSAVDVLQNGKPVARLVHGEGQIKPFLHVFGTDGELVTNPGVDKEGKGAGLFNHHRGIFIGWNKVSSELGTYDMWHRGGPGQGRYDIVKFENKVGKKFGSIVANIKWRATKKDAAGSDVIITERRVFKVSRPRGAFTQVDASFELNAERDVSLGGDLQHAGVHFVPMLRLQNVTRKQAICGSLAKPRALVGSSMTTTSGRGYFSQLVNGGTLLRK